MVMSYKIGNTSSNELCVMEYRETCVAIRIKLAYERQDPNPMPLFSQILLLLLFVCLS